MRRPVMLMCYRLSRELKIDVDIIKDWPLDKVLDWVAFFRTEDKDWQEKYKIESMTKEEQIREHERNIKLFDSVVGNDI